MPLGNYRLGNSGLVPPGPLGNVASDAGKRASDIVTNALLVDPRGNRGRIVAIRLSDGGSDGVIYDNVADAANSQLHYKACAYVRIPGDGMSPREADIWIAYHRKCYDGGNLPDYLNGVPLRVPNMMELH